MEVRLCGWAKAIRRLFICLSGKGNFNFAKFSTNTGQLYRISVSRLFILFVKLRVFLPRLTAYMRNNNRFVFEVVFRKNLNNLQILCIHNFFLI